MSRIRRFVDFIATPLGRFVVIVDEEGCLRVSGFAERHARVERELERHAAGPDIELVETADPAGISSAVARYFAGELGALVGLPMALEGTPFQLQVWHALATIPCGETRSYAELARAVGRPAAVRAVGMANGSNPLGLILPCHRVVGSDGSLTGYGGGVERKQWLLFHERGAAQQRAFAFAAPDARRR